jgi:hypothetical protein
MRELVSTIYNGMGDSLLGSPYLFAGIALMVSARIFRPQGLKASLSP